MVQSSNVTAVMERGERGGNADESMKLVAGMVCGWLIRPIMTFNDMGSRSGQADRAVKAAAGFQQRPAEAARSKSYFGGFCPIEVLLRETANI